MRSVAKVTALFFAMLLLITVTTEVIMFYTAQARIVAISGFVLQTSAELGSRDLDQVSVELEVDTGTDTGIYSKGIIDSFKEACDIYYSTPDQPISFVVSGSSNLNVPSKGLNKPYDHKISYEYLGTPTDETRIKSLDIFMTISDEVLWDGSIGDGKQLDIAVHSTLFFNSAFLRDTIGVNTITGDIIYFDTVLYRVVTYY